MIDLAEFLLGRYDEDEAEARGAAAVHLGADESRWKGVAWGEGIGQVLVDGPRGMPVADTQNRGDFGGLGWYAARHIARWDPARVLAECQAHRRIVEERQQWESIARAEATHEYGPEGLTDGARTACEVLDEVLQLLALPYADHPDYRQEWRPDDAMPRGQYGPTADYGE